jgi:hypothetical protein
VLGVRLVGEEPFAIRIVAFALRFWIFSDVLPVPVRQCLRVFAKALRLHQVDDDTRCREQAGSAEMIEMEENKEPPASLLRSRELGLDCTRSVRETDSAIQSRFYSSEFCHGNFDIVSNVSHSRKESGRWLEIAQVALAARY